MGVLSCSVFLAEICDYIFLREMIVSSCPLRLPRLFVSRCFAFHQCLISAEALTFLTATALEIAVGSKALSTKTRGVVTRSRALPSEWSQVSTPNHFTIVSFDLPLNFFILVTTSVLEKVVGTESCSIKTSSVATIRKTFSFWWSLVSSFVYFKVVFHVFPFLCSI